MDRSTRSLKSFEINDERMFVREFDSCMVSTHSRLVHSGQS